MRKILAACLLLAVAPLASAADAKKPVAVPQAAAKPAPTAEAGKTARFSMTQNGKKMTADDFDAWMKAQGYQKPVEQAAPAAEPSAPVAEEGKKKKKK